MGRIIDFLKSYATLILLAIAFFGGYYVSDLQHDKQQLKQEQAQQKQFEKEIENNAENAEQLENKLIKVEHYEQIISEQQDNNNKKIDRGNTDCNSTDVDFVELFNSQNKEYERILSSEHDARVSAGTTKNNN